MELVLCVTGSVAAIQAFKLARELKRQGINVKCFMSDDACHIIHPYTMEFATGQKVVTQLSGEIEHVKYAQFDLVLVAPATANVISKFAYKIADNPINTLLITAFGYKTPIIIVPSMHFSMYEAVYDNIQKLKDQKVVIVDPKREEDKAKFPDIQDIILQVNRETDNNELDKKRVLVSAGATFEELDPVRGITNRSSGKMGLEMAKEAFIRGAEVTMVCGRMEVKTPSLFKILKTESTEDMRVEIEKEVLNNDIFISAAAVSDFTPEKPFEENPNKISSKTDYTLKLRPTPKIIENVKKFNPNIFLVGFKAEYDVSEQELIQSALQKMQESQADLMVANDVAVPGSGFGSEENQVYIIDDEVMKIPLTSKKEVAQKIFDRIMEKQK